MPDPTLSSSSAPAPPALSVVVVCERGLAGMRRTVAALAAQTAAARIELLAVGPDNATMDDAALSPGAAERLGAVRLIRRPQITNVDHDLVPGVAAATAPVVVLLEDHAFPHRDWAAKAIAAWEQAPADVVAVGFGITNANPRSSFSWANMLLAYGRWMPHHEGERGSALTATHPPTAAEPTDWVAAHNVSLRRDALHGLGDRLAGLTGREGLFLRTLRDAGGAFRHARDARIAHVNPSTLRATAALRTDAGRLYGARRAQDDGWGPVRRGVYVLLSPLIAPLRFVRERQTHFGGGRRSALTPRVYPALAAALVFDALGQALGYASGAGGAPQRLATFEMDRGRHVTRRDRVERLA